MENTAPRIQIIRVSEDNEYETIFAIRREVFVDEQGVPEEDEYDGYEHISNHYLALLDGVPAGTARWRITPGGKLKAERFAVKKEFRGHGVGRALVETVVREMPKHLEAYLNAQIDVVGLYEKFGFVAEGEVFDECGIMHRKMVLKRETDKNY